MRISGFIALKSTLPMRKLLLFSLMSFLFCCSLAYSQVQWKGFESPEHKFRASFPGTVKQTKSANPPDEGGYSYDFKSVNTPLRQLFAVHVIDDPAAHSSPTDDQLRVRLDRSRNSAVSGIPDGKLVSERDIKWNGRLGREFIVENKGFLLRIRLHYYQNRLFMVTAMMRKSPPDDERFDEYATKFLDSFVLLP